MKFSEEQLRTIEVESVEFLSKYPLGRVRIPIDLAKKWLLENKSLEIENNIFYLTIKHIGLEIYEVEKTESKETSLKDAAIKG